MFTEGGGSLIKLVDIVAGYAATLLLAALARNSVPHRNTSSVNLMINEGNAVVIDWGFAAGIFDIYNELSHDESENLSQLLDLVNAKYSKKRSAGGYVFNETTPKPGRLGPRRGAGGGVRGDVDEFGRERRSRPHQRKPYDRPNRGPRGAMHAGGRGGSAGRQDEASDIESRLSSLIIKVGDKNTPTLQNNLEALSVVLEKDYTKHERTVLRTFRECVLELPWKVTVYSTLAGLLNAKNNETGGKVVSLMHQVLRRELTKGRWGSVKVLMRFFALLVNTNTISASTLLSMIDTFLKPVATDEGSDVVVSVSGNCYVYIAMSTLLWAGHALKERVPQELDRRIQLVRRYVDEVAEYNKNNSLAVVFHDAPPKGTNALASLLDTLGAVAAKEWKIDTIFSPYEMFASEFSQATAHELPVLELPTDLAPAAFHTPSECLQLVLSPSDQTVHRYILQDLITDTVVQLETNRKDCAKYILQIHGLCNEDICSVMTTAQHPDDADPETSLVFEYILAEVVVSTLLQLPDSMSREMYYTALAVELRKAEPQIMANVFETVVDNIVARLKSVDVECINRLSNWLAVYISNFNFQWDWAKWESVAEEPENSPKRCFVQETLLKLVRLSYLDRIKSLLPESYAPLIPAKTPSHNFKFTMQAMDERTREVSVAMGKCLKNKGTADQAMEILQENYSQWSDIDEDTRQSLAREMLVEHVLLLGSKTFSHMLNAIEKFLPALQRFNDTSEAKLQIAKVTEDFWLRHSQFFVITIDKMITYRVIDSAAVLKMLFDLSHVGNWCKFYHWEILRNTVNKLNLRVAQLRSRLDAAYAAASTMADEADGSEQQQPADTIEQVEAMLEQMVQEQKDIVISATRYFVQLLSSANGTADEMDRAWLLGRFKEFMRTYRTLIVENAQTLENVVFTAEASEDARLVFDNIRALCA
ncbi:Nuclear cap-binding protein subunit 1 [Coemansia sp. RSA 1813]|nr:Nuclear cap-binding protein subunit 1 [Coemansia sp. RSA 986]KAJ2217487.1 Nuclear cap-binding protein subunit 1 [Coemansia sp. RSA 487]KAJ2573501.1 Nuclear cap-binding protein subunit 1 [Coemansia sp. RSA 1813]